MDYYTEEEKIPVQKPYFTPFGKEVLASILNRGCWTDAEKVCIKEQVERANKLKLQKFTVTIDATNSFKVENGVLVSIKSNR